jgi:hypothetical protein
MIWILGVIVSLIQVIQGFRQKKPWLIITCLLLAIALVFLGVDQVNRNNGERKHLTERIDTLIANRAKDSLFNDTFLKKLLDSFHIKKDSITNTPKFIGGKYQTNIDKARDVFIGDRR